ncbi:heavy metal-associated isoprenylated plant protein 23-like [Phragmites australis]|uniref:heavy metal-associated isoprenylated plant protein 23-like n=1 Tax=Phragmites australis TaxID=29695 RepID=UPI002D7971F0|nr:heavy metal-associated isoprenylated plant protein 23-like [Phragmites australis]
MGGFMKQIRSLLGAINGGHRKKKKKMQRRQVQAVELRVRMDCERCEREVKKALSSMRGVQHVEVNRLQQKVTITGEVDPHAVLRRAQSTGKKAEPWPQNPPAAVALYGIGVAQLQAHDNRWAPAPAPASACYYYPRSVEAGIGAEQITNLFSDDNPNACSVM